MPSFLGTTVLPSGPRCPVHPLIPLGYVNGVCYVCNRFPLMAEKRREARRVIRFLGYCALALVLGVLGIMAAASAWATWNQVNLEVKADQWTYGRNR